MFVGEYSHSIDAKGRLIVPAKFREQLGSVFYITRGLDPCLYAYTEDEWEKIAERFMSQSSGPHRENRKFNRFFFAGAVALEFDKQGRILIPQKLREYASIKGEVVFAGVLNKIEIWDKEAWESGTSYDDMDEVAERLADMGIQL